MDTPGVLSGEKQRIERTYPFIEVRRAARGTWGSAAQGLVGFRVACWWL